MPFLPSWITRKKSNAVTMSVKNKEAVAAKILKNEEKLAKKAHTERVIAGLTGTGTSVASGITQTLGLTKLLATGALVSAVTVPPIAPAIIGIIVLITFILKQKGLHEELAAGLFVAKERLERIARLHAVVKEIAKENDINLNTAELCLVMDSVKHKVTKFADTTTKNNIQVLEDLLKRNQLDKAKQIVEDADNIGEDNLRKSLANSPSGSNDPKSPVKGGGLFSGLSHWSARWLSPDDTLRKVIKEIDLVTSWFSIMLGEFDVFMRYVVGNNSEKKNKWKQSAAMKDLLFANLEIGRAVKGKNDVNASNSPDFNVFYSVLDLKDGLRDVTETINEKNKELTIRSPVGGKRKTLRHKKRRVF
jgi:hypothetical protein